MRKLTRSSGRDNPDTVTLALAGDVMLGRLVRDAIKERGYTYPWGDILPALAGADRFLVNLECALTSETRRWYDGEPKPFHFRADPDMAAALTAGGVDGVSLANNHIGDFGDAGLLETVRVLDRAGIAHAGAGMDLAGARAPARFLARGRRVALFAAADHPAAWRASAGAPGMHFLPVPPGEAELGPLLDAIQAERSRAEHIVLSLHWGPNMLERPSAEFRSLAHRMLDAGVDVVWGHSAHIPQGIELSEEKLILYDTGDLIDDYAVDPQLRNDLGAIFLVTLGCAGVDRLEVIPIQIADRQARLARGEGAAWITRRIARLSAEFHTTLHPENDHLTLSPVGGGVR
jgi:poly-gamma-glutamate capsule biosynthesis protein CapA/YwtB (metallophosphatase superfamily)